MAATGTQQGGLTVATSGAEAVGAAVSETITEDLKLAESVAIPITMIVLLVVFGSLVSAGLPLVVAAGSVLGSFLVLWLITQVTDVSIFGLNLITGLGLGLGIDYALLMVNRFREERARGLAPDRAVVRTVATAGRTVAVSGVTVAVTLAALLFFPQYFLRSFGYAGISVTLLAVLSAITALPAAMALLGARTDSLRIRRGDLAPSDDGAWARVARAVMRRPVLVAVSVSAVLLSVGSLALGASFSQVDDRALPADNPATAAASLLRESFPGEEGAPVQVVLAGAKASDPAAVTAHAATLSELDGVVRVVSPTEVFIDGESVGPNPTAGASAETSPGGWVRLDVVGDVAPRSAEGADLVESVRAVPWSGESLVGGAAAEYADSQAAIAATLPLALGWVFALTLIVLFLYTGSVVLPIKAVLLNILSLAATIGALVWVFQDGNLGWLVGRLPVHRHPGHLDDRADRDRRLRPVDGLRGVPAVTDQGGARCRGRHRDRRRAGPAAIGPDHHRRRRAAGDRLRLVHHQRGDAHQAARLRRRVRDPAGCDDRARAHGPGVHAPRGPLELVGTRSPGSPAPADRAVRGVRLGPSAPEWDPEGDHHLRCRWSWGAQDVVRCMRRCRRGPPIIQNRRIGSQKGKKKPAPTMTTANARSSGTARIATGGRPERCAGTGAAGTTPDRIAGRSTNSGSSSSRYVQANACSILAVNSGTVRRPAAWCSPSASTASSRS